MSESGNLGELNGMEVAIIGMAGRFPGARNLEELWQLLKDGIDAVRYLTEEELEQGGVDPAEYRSPRYVRAYRSFDGYDLFDASFFSIGPREADVMDPQHRTFLECCWEALENAGYDPERVPGQVGVFAGSRIGAYLMNVYSNPRIARTAGDLMVQTSNDKDYLATRVSYKLNLGGPSVTVQTACSTALVGVHMACQALLAGECEMALAGGVSVRVPELGYLFTEGELASPDGMVRAFDAKASGTVFGSGLGVVVLKRLEDALADRDLVRAVIKGSAVTNDGSRKVGFTAPGVDGQARVLRAAQITADVAPDSIDYIEAHGTGTPIGDPIEVSALTQVFREHTDRRQFCALGSIKSNVGHLGAAAGAAGLIKAVLAIEHGEIPPSIHFEEPNPQIDFEASPFYVNTEHSPWPRKEGPRRAGVSAFGIGGTNAHIVLEEAPPRAASGASRPWQLLVLSARTSTALETMSTHLAAHLESHPALPLADAAYTLQVGRKVLEHRRIAVVKDTADAVATLREGVAGRVRASFFDGKERPVAFLFSGQGAQYPRMAADVYASEATFRRELDRCCELLRPHLDADLRELLFPDEERLEEAGERLSQTAFTQPALFAVEYSLARQWMEWGIVPEAMIGHSIGEYVAAALAGVFSLEDALALVAARGRLMQSLPAGAMLAVPLPEEEVAELLGKQLSLAAINAPNRCVVSGPEEAVEELRGRLAERKVACRRLHTSHAFHSNMMEPILSPFMEVLAGVELAPPEIPYVSNVTGTWVTEAETTDPGYWAAHLRGAVRFADGLTALFEEPRRCLLEVGPGKTLSMLARQHPAKGEGHVVLSSLRHPKDREDDLAFALRTLGELWLAGVAVDWESFASGEERLRAPLPPYPFERQRYWIEAGDFHGALGQKSLRRKKDVADWFYLPYWKPSVPPLPAADEELAGRRWLLFLDDRGLGERMAERLERAGADVVVVRPADDFASLEQGAYGVSPARREDYDALVESLASEDRLPDVAVHLWCVTGEPEPGGPEAARRLEERAFWSLLYLTQALGKGAGRHPLALTVVSDNLQRVGGERFLSPVKATLLGPTRMIPQEYPDLRASAVDVLLPEAGGPPQEELAETLLAEAVGELSDPIVAYRSGGRWLRDYQPAPVGPVPGEDLRFRQGGVYLVTGGLGGLGLAFAEALAGDYAAKLALVGRTPLPPREEWEGYLAKHPAGDRTAERIRKVTALEEAGGEVLVLAADIGDREAVHRVVAETRERFGALHGVIHAAGVPGAGVMQLKKPEVAAEVLRPKVEGTLALEAALDGEPLDFLVLCSSTIAVLGGFGQVDYCAANSFLDAFAQARELAGGPYTVSINWGAWQEVGMAVDSGMFEGSGAPAGGSGGEAVDHPLIDRCEGGDAERATYATRLGVDRHWVVAEHHVAGIPTVPGTAHLEIVRAAFAHHAATHLPAGGSVELRDVHFVSPLMLPGGTEREVRITLERAGDAFGFRVASTRPNQADEELHARGQVAWVAPPEPTKLDLDALRERYGRRIEIAGEHINDKDTFVYWGPHWQSLHTIWAGEDGGLALLEMPEELAGEVADYVLHPALLDVATSIITFLEEESYLPMSYRRVSIAEPLPPRLYAHLEKVGGGGGKETVSVDVALLDEAGNRLVEVGRFTLKKVGGAVSRLAQAGAGGARPAEASAVRPAEPAAGSGPAPEPAAEGILSREGVDALRRILHRRRSFPQVVVSAKDIHGLLEQLAELAASRFGALSPASQEAAGVHPRPNLSVPYSPPTNDVERVLAEIWASALGIDQVGIHDNFFDMGGDSIVGLQLISKANEAGFELSPDQLFEYQTIAGLAALLAPGAAVAEETAEDAAVPADATEEADLDLTDEELEKVFEKIKGLS